MQKKVYPRDIVPGMRLLEAQIEGDLRDTHYAAKTKWDPEQGKFQRTDGGYWYIVEDNWLIVEAPEPEFNEWGEIGL